MTRFLMRDGKSAYPLSLSRHDLKRHWRVGMGQDSDFILFSRGILYLHRPSGIWYHVECLHRPAIGSQVRRPAPLEYQVSGFWHHKHCESALLMDGQKPVRTALGTSRHLSCREDTCITADGSTFRPGVWRLLMVLCCQIGCLRQHRAAIATIQQQLPFQVRTAFLATFFGCLSSREVNDRVE